MYQDAFDAFGNLGLKREEARIYMVCLRNKGGLFTHEITKLSGIKRSTVDLIIRRLIAKNFLSSFREGRRRKFVAESPETILFDFQRGLEDFRTMLPMLMRLSANTEQTRVTFHEGAKGVKAIYDDVILTLKDLPLKERINYCITSGREIEKIYPRFEQQFVAHRIRNRIWNRMIAMRSTPNQSWSYEPKDLRTIKLFDGKNYPFGIEFLITGTKVMFVSAHKPVGGIIIQNKLIAHSMRSLFNLLWDSLGSEATEPPASKSR